MLDTPADKTGGAEAPLQLLLFVDQRPTAPEQIRQIRRYLQASKTATPWELQIIDVVEQPYLAEHYKLVATPALIKTHPQPQHTLAGGNLTSQLETWWPRWQESVAVNSSAAEALPNPNQSPASVAQLMQLSDQIFHLKQEQEILQEQLQFKDRIIAMLAHDLRNPLTAASIALGTLEGGCDPEEDSPFTLTPELIVRLTQHIRTQTRIIDRMITTILQIDQGETAKLHLQPQKLDLRQLYQEALEQLKGRLEAKSQHLRTDLPADLPYVYADGDRLRQVLLNLLDNAIKYTPENGLIEVSGLHRTAQKVQISVCDNGPGIPIENEEPNRSKLRGIRLKRE